MVGKLEYVPLQLRLVLVTLGDPNNLGDDLVLEVREQLDLGFDLA